MSMLSKSDETSPPLGARRNGSGECERRLSRAHEYVAPMNYEDGPKVSLVSVRWSTG
jgi:hypothetical protein